MRKRKKNVRHGFIEKNKKDDIKSSEKLRKNLRKLRTAAKLVSLFTSCLRKVFFLGEHRQKLGLNLARNSPTPPQNTAADHVH